jgi:hypothetical protein
MFDQNYIEDHTIVSSYNHGRNKIEQEEC